MDAQKIAADNLFFLTLAGSHAYGMATEYSDKDYRGLFYLPQNLYMSIFKNVEQVEQFGGEKDSVVYELSKYIKLLVDQNPNIMELLWVDDKFVVQRSFLFDMLRSKREFFLSSKAKHTFSGYAMSQLKRIRGHNKWIENPQPKRRPKEIDFLTMIWNGTNNKKWNKEVPLLGVKAYSLGHDVYGLIGNINPMEPWHDNHEALIIQEKTDIGGMQFAFIIKFNRQLYREAVDNWQHYWDWKENRNEARASLEEKHGYDTKHASHLIRLFRMGIEILRGEGVKVLRPDAQELLAIRNGSMTYDQLITYSQELDLELEALYKTTKLHHHIDQEDADRIVQEVYQVAWTYGKNGNG